MGLGTRRAKKVEQRVLDHRPVRQAADLGLMLACALLFGTTPAHAMGTLFAEKTVGEQFREVIAEIDAQCRREKVGPYLDPKDPKYRDKMRYTHCDILKLKPYDPLATPEGRFAHSLKLPPLYDQVHSVYRAGMTGDEYFKALCEGQAGEFIFRTANGVEGVLQARPYQQSPNSYYDVVFYSVEKSEVNLKNLPDTLVRGRASGFLFVEVPRRGQGVGPSTPPFIRFVRSASPAAEKAKGAHEDGKQALDAEHVWILKSKFGFTWRGINHPMMVEHGVEGAELLLFEISTQDVLALRRFFTRYRPAADYRDKRYALVEHCPLKFQEPPHAFIQRVLIPLKNVR